MSYASLDVAANSIVSVTQNEANSSIYVLQGNLRVENLGGATTRLSSGQRISIARQSAADGDADLEAEKGNIDSFFQSSDWFLENEGFLILEAQRES